MLSNESHGESHGEPHGGQQRLPSFCHHLYLPHRHGKVQGLQRRAGGPGDIGRPMRPGQREAGQREDIIRVIFYDVDFVEEGGSTYLYLFYLCLSSAGSIRLQ